MSSPHHHVFVAVDVACSSCQADNTVTCMICPAWKYRTLCLACGEVGASGLAAGETDGNRDDSRVQQMWGRDQDNHRPDDDLPPVLGGVDGGERVGQSRPSDSRWKVVGRGGYREDETNVDRGPDEMISLFAERV